MRDGTDHAASERALGPFGAVAQRLLIASGEGPSNRVVDHSDPDNASVEPLESAVLAELQGRYLNPA